MSIQQFKGTYCNVDFGAITESSFMQLLESYSTRKKLILVDENTQENCLEYLITSFEQLANAEVIVVPAGEDSKSLEIAGQLWEVLLSYEVTKKDLLICLGGGVVSDLGGFVAATYKRGLSCIFVPTTLLSMVDAAIGGKNGIDFGGIKNAIGSIVHPEHIFIDPGFLSSLPQQELQSGLGECVKHALIQGEAQWQSLKDFLAKEKNSGNLLSNELLWQLIQTKINIVEQDPLEKDLRQVLNLGHTFAHALESHFLQEEKQMSHGLAVVYGLLIEGHISWQKGILDKAFYSELVVVLSSAFDLTSLTFLDLDKLALFLNQDKKNQENEWRYIALKTPGNYLLNQVFSMSELQKALAAF
ncbi:MAG: hypothetical protein RLZZ65_1018 [Bacteroidota bacterium]|jgi:3-dehydroquinate synthase